MPAWSTCSTPSGTCHQRQSQITLWQPRHTSKAWRPSASALAEAVKKWPGNAVYMFSRAEGEAKLEIRQQKDIKRFYQDAIQADPENSHYLRCLGDFVRPDSTVVASQHYRGALKLDSNNGMAYVGLALLQRRAPALALEDFQRAIDTDSTDPELYAARGTWFMEAKSAPQQDIPPDYERAVQDFTAAIQYDQPHPFSNPEYRLRRAESYARLGKIAQQISDLSVAIELPLVRFATLERFVSARWERARAFRQLGESVRAIADLEAALQFCCGSHQAAMLQAELKSLRK
eukprot:TRINITY_DN4577_c0_g1_i4.p2 TRINITY_DN4577_c0_g1~~TRINITY_DN4577_c0_g1_i4.p2  ORF type:complete len:289 (+),score=40.71 TRINITY_DN4577_c0_g1_i4:709-1575(+)